MSPRCGSVSVTRPSSPDTRNEYRRARADRRKVEVRAASAGLRDPAAKLALAQELLAAASDDSAASHALLSSLLEAVGNDDYFMLED